MQKTKQNKTKQKTTTKYKKRTNKQTNNRKQNVNFRMHICKHDVIGDTPVVFLI